MAGFRLAQQITSLVGVAEDQKHPRIVLISMPDRIPDRTEYLLSGLGDNPALGILECIDDLSKAGATVLGVSCNTAHAEPIWREMVAGMEARASHLRLISMIDALIAEVSVAVPMRGRIGVLATRGTIRADTFGKALKDIGREVVYPDIGQELRVHDAIYNRQFGIKATASPTEQARMVIVEVIAEMIRKGVDALILGCTELPLAVEQDVFDGVRLFDPSAALARSLLSEWGGVSMDGSYR